MEKQKAEVGKAYRTPLLPELRSVDEKARTIEFVASTEAVDRYGDVIRCSGWKLDNYLQNPIFLWAHESSEPPIGKCVGLSIESNPPALVQKIQFADAATYPFADVIFNLYRGGFMRAVSVGFMPLEQPVPMKDADGYTTGWEFNGQELLELSAVPIPANADALARAVQKGFSESDLALVFSGKGDSLLTSLRLENAALKQEIADLKMPPQESAEILTLEQLRDAVKQAGASIKSEDKSPASDEITTLDQLVEGEHEITTLAQLGEALHADKAITTIEALATDA